MDPQEPAADRSCSSTRTTPYHWVSIKCTVAARGVRGRPARGRAGHRPARQDLDQVHEAAAAVRAARPVDRRAPRAVRVRRSSGWRRSASPDRPDGDPRGASPSSVGRWAGLTAALVLRDLGRRGRPSTSGRRPSSQQRGAGIGFLPDSSRYLVERAGVALDASASPPRTSATSARDGERRARRGAHLPVQLVEHGLPRAAGLLRPRPRTSSGHEMTGFGRERRCASRSHLAGRPARPSTCWCAPTASARPRAPAAARACGRPTPATWRGGAWCPEASLDAGDARRARRRHHLLRLRQQPHPRVPDPGRGRVGRARASGS